MAQAGKYVDWNALRLTCDLAAVAFTKEGTLFDPGPGTAQVLSRYDTGANPEATGVYMSVEANYQLDRIDYVFQVPLLGIDWSDTDAGAGTATLQAYFYGFLLHALDSIGWRLYVSRVELWKNGSLEQTWDAGGSGFEMYTGNMVPTGVPLFGIPGRIQGGAGPGPLLPSGAGGDVFKVETTATAEGCWEFQEVDAGAWTELPLELNVESFVGSCECDTETATPPSGSTTRSVVSFAKDGAEGTNEEGEVVVCPNPCDPPGPDAAYRIDFATQRQWRSKSHVTCVPNLLAAIDRINPDFGAMVARWTLPQVRAHRFASCKVGETEAEAVTTFTEDYVTVRAAQTFIEQRVDNATAAIEDTLAFDIPAPYYFDKYEKLETAEYVVEVEPVQLCHPPQPPWSCGPEGDYPITTFCESFAFVELEGADAPGSGNLPFLSSTSPVARLVNYIGCPLWSFAYPFYDWSGLDRRELWMATRSQHQSVGTGSRSAKRNSIVSCPLDEGGFREWFETVYGGARPIGVSRWQTDVVAILADYTYDEDLHTSLVETEDCDVSLGASNITVNPDPGVSVCEVKIRLGSWEHEPFLYPHLCGQIRPDWSPTNVSVMRVYVESVDGTRALLEQTPGDGFTTPDVIYDRPTADDEKYAGSWAINNANGVVADEGSDSEPEGISAATMADPERALAFQLLKGYGGKYLVFQIEPTDPDSDVTLEYPQIYAAAGSPGLTWEHGAACNFVYPDSVGLRWGNHQYVFSGLDLLPTPLVLGLGWHKSSVLDHLCMRRQLFEAKAFDDGLATEGEALYSEFEGNEVEDLALNKLAFLLPMDGAVFKAALVDMFAELPPMGHFPVRQRDADWEPTGDFGQVVYSHSQEPRYYVSRADELNVLDGTDQWTASDTAPASGWSRTKHSHTVVNTETGGFTAKGGDKNLALVSPWHGYFALFGVPTGTKPVSYDVSPSNRHARMVTDDDSEAFLQVSSNNDPRLQWSEPLAAGFDVADATLRWIGSSGFLGLLYSPVDGGIYWRTSSDEGRNWSAPVEYSATATRTAWLFGRDRRFYLYWVDDGSIIGTVLDYEGNVVIPEFTLISGGVDDLPIAVDEDWAAAGGWRILVRFFSDGELTEWATTNGTVIT